MGARCRRGAGEVQVPCSGGLGEGGGVGHLSLLLGNELVHVAFEGGVSVRMGGMA